MENQKRPLIGLVPLMDYQRASYWMLPGYMQGVEQAGGVPVMLPLTEDDLALAQLADTCDGFLLTGGQDVAPALYGAAQTALCGETSPQRDVMEQKLLALARLQDKPVLGICRGLQFLNTHTGGTLYQDLPSEHPGLSHRMAPPYDRAVHQVTIERESPLFEIVGDTGYGVNSCHHQAIRDLSPILSAAAVSEDGLIEAAWMPGKHFILGVQWHPEFSYQSDPVSMRLFEAFVKAAKYPWR